MVEETMNPSEMDQPQKYLPDGETQSEAANDRVDRVKAIITILMAVVTAYSMAVAVLIGNAAGNAMGGESNGLTATYNVEQVLTYNYAVMFRHYRAYSAYLENSKLTDSSATGQNAPAMLAAVNKLFFSPRYLQRDGTYNYERELAEAWAEAGRTFDLDPDPSFKTADQSWNQFELLTGVMLATILALVLFSVALQMNNAYPILIYATSGVALMITIASVIALVLVFMQG